MQTHSLSVLVDNRDRRADYSAPKCSVLRSALHLLPDASAGLPYAT